MIALGMAPGGVGVPPPLHAVSAGAFTVIAVDPDLATTPRDRLLRQITVMEVLPAFVPFAPATVTPVARALAWARSRDQTIAFALSRVEGRCLMVLDLARPVAATTDPRAWLRQRASILSVPEGLQKRLAPFGRATGLRRSRTGAAIDILVERTGLAGLRQAVVAACDGADLRGWSAALVGPLPVMALHGLESAP